MQHGILVQTQIQIRGPGKRPRGEGAQMGTWRLSASDHLCLLLSSPDYGLPGAGAISISFLVPSDTLNGLVYQVSP